MPEKIFRMTKRSGPDLQAEGQKVWKEFEKTVTLFPGFDELQKMRRFPTFEGATEGTHLYTHFPFLFSPAFPEINRKQMRRLSLLSLFYLYHILIADELMDEEIDAVHPALFLSNTCWLKAMEILDSLFVNRTLPWKDLKRLHWTYAEATLIESRFHSGEVGEYQKDDLFRILAGKSAMAKLILVSLCRLSGRESYLKPLVRSFEYFYLADQLFDDFRDWKKDLESRRYSYLLTQVITSYQLTEKLSGLDGKQAVNLVGKHLYLSGILEQYFSEVADYRSRAKQRVAGIDCPSWTALLDALQLKVKVVRADIGRQSRKLLLQENDYDYRLIPETEIREARSESYAHHNGVGHPVRWVATGVFEAVGNAAEFLVQSCQRDKWFEDFMVFGAPMTIWVSAYVALALHEWNIWLKKRAPAGYSTFNRSLKKLAKLLADKRKENGWSPAESAPIDADTSAWVIAFLRCSSTVKSEVLDHWVRDLLEFQRADGGFRTYLPNSVGREFEAYSASHVEVTAVVLEVLRLAGAAPDSEAIRKGLEFIDRMRNPDGLWEAYWWDGQMFATYHCIKAQMACGAKPGQEEIEKLLSRITAMQEEDGCWGMRTKGKNIAFETALALKAALLLDRTVYGEKWFEKGVTWLLNNQGVDRAWESGPMMRVPEGTDLKPWEYDNWKQDMINGVGILVRDQNRYFTTATALSALTDYLVCAGDHRLVAHRRKPGTERTHLETGSDRISNFPGQPLPLRAQPNRAGDNVGP